VQLIIVRHALPIRTDDSADPPLSEEGHRQAEATAAFLAGERVDHVAVSPLLRAQQTATPLTDKFGLAAEEVEHLREIDPFHGAYIPAEELADDHQVVQDFAADPYSLFANVGGFANFRELVRDAFEGIIAGNKGRTVAVFCHGTVIGTYLTTLLGTDDPFALLPDYCGLSRVLATGDWRTLRSVNETAHLRDLIA
jgi:2,3-bisphosphoglycerate-dependent phosphoglycerate mutase